MNERPLVDVVRDLTQANQILNVSDDRISQAITSIENRLRELKLVRIISAKLPDGAELGWSYTKRGNRWRFVIRSEDDAWELQSCSREERSEVFTCGAMGKLIAQAMQDVRPSGYKR